MPQSSPEAFILYFHALTDSWSETIDHLVEMPSNTVCSDWMYNTLKWWLIIKPKSASFWVNGNQCIGSLNDLYYCRNWLKCVYSMFDLRASVTVMSNLFADAGMCVISTGGSTFTHLRDKDLQQHQCVWNPGDYRSHLLKPAQAQALEINWVSHAEAMLCRKKAGRENLVHLFPDQSQSIPGLLFGLGS